MRSKQKQNALIAIRTESEEWRGLIKMREGVLMGAVTSELNGENKPKFSNEAARNAELLRRKASDELIKEYTEKLQGLTSDDVRKNNEIEKLRTRVSLYKAFLYGSSTLAAV